MGDHIASVKTERGASFSFEGKYTGPAVASWFINVSNSEYVQYTSHANYPLGPLSADSTMDFLKHEQSQRVVCYP